MIKQVLHSRRGDLLSIVLGLELQISKDKQNRSDTYRLEEAKRLIEEELGLRGLTPYSLQNTALV